MRSEEGVWIERGLFWSPGRWKSWMKWYEECNREEGRFPVTSCWEGRVSELLVVWWDDLQYLPLQNRGIGSCSWYECKCWRICSGVDAWLWNE